MEKERIEIIIKQMKKEIKEELRKEILQELKGEVLPKKGENFDFNAYKNQVVADDINKAQEFIKINQWYWYIPIIGYFIYMYQLGQTLTSIDRGVLRKQINRASLPWLWLDIPFTYIFPIVIIFNYWPGRTKKIILKAIKMTKENIE